MSNAVLIIHSAADAADNRALTAVRLAGAMLADGKDVNLFLVEGGARLIDPQLPQDNACGELFRELLEAGLTVHLCGATMRKWGWEENQLPPGVQKSSMKALSALLSTCSEQLVF